MTTKIEELEFRITDLQTLNEELRAVFREAIGGVHDYKSFNTATTKLLNALRTTQLEQNQKLNQHSYVLAGLVEGQKELQDGQKRLQEGLEDLRVAQNGLQVGQTDLTEGQRQLNERMDRLEQLIRHGFKMGRDQ